MSGWDDIVAGIDACAAGSVRHCDDLHGRYGRYDLRAPERDRILDELARRAVRSPTALDLLVRFVYDERFVRAEIRKVLINDTSAAEEALQETALAVVRSVATFRGESSFRSWVCTIGRNQAIAVLRRRRPTVGIGSSTSGAEEPAGDGVGVSELERYSSLLADRADLSAALATLSDEFREAVRLRDIEQRSYQEIADTLGIKLNTVRSRLARGRAQLALVLEATS